MLRPRLRHAVPCCLDERRWVRVSKIDVECQLITIRVTGPPHQVRIHRHVILLVGWGWVVRRIGVTVHV
ncbi:MAG: hypothetical protein KAJ01_08820, partial [Candidatus Hydrogenedentes bacterium]|nr:hypothetical protein [Candidatus Hydrogenedentota bacterium]